MTGRPVLRDAIERRERFEAAHPDVTIIGPATLTARWLAVVPMGCVPGDPERTMLSAWQLADLMDRLDQIWPPDG